MGGASGQVEWRTTGRRVAGALAVLVLAAGCSGGGPQDEPPEPARPASANEVAGLAVGEESVTVAAAGDIARKAEDGAGTAALIKQVGADAVLPLGDLAYDAGSPEEFRENYAPTWGKFRAITRPTPGNHEYKTPGAAGYFGFFREQIGDRPYYAWDAGTWRMYALNCDVDCGRDSEQLQWLRKDLASHDKPAVGYLHQPFFTCSTRHPPAQKIDDIWAALQEGSGQILLSGDNHAYERFARLDVDGQPAPDGLRQFVVGTGGVKPYPLRETCANRESGYDGGNGILELTLEPDSFSWRFLAVDGTVMDRGADKVR